MKKNIVAIQIDELDQLNFTNDTSLLFAYALQNHFQKYRIFLYQAENITYSTHIETLHAYGAFYNIQYSKRETFSVTKISEFETIDLKSVALILIRQNPPFDMNYITNLYLLKLIKHHTLTLNDPDTILNFPEKFIPIFLKNTIPETIITSNCNTVVNFIKKYKEVVLKPIYSFGGNDIVKINSDDYNEIDLHDTVMKYLNESKLNSIHWIIVQKFISSIYKQGDYRVIIIDGQILSYFKRLPQNGKFVANLAQGGTAEKVDHLSQNLLENLIDLGNSLKNNGIFFAGVDVIEDKIIEVNITSPTGVITACNITHSNLEFQIADIINTKIQNFITSNCNTVDLLCK